MPNRYDEVYDFRLATVQDVDDIMKFIREEWGANHILAHDKTLFLWQYGCTEYGNTKDINVVLMTLKDGTIVGMIGFVPYSNDKDNLHISTAITKIKSGDILPMAGLELMRRQMQIVGEKANFASGTNPNTILPLFNRVFKHKTGIMQQYYILNPDVGDYHIAVVPDTEIKECNYCSYPIALKEVDTFEQLSLNYDLSEKKRRMSIKSPEYINKRYFNHPYYSYRKWVLKNEDGLGIGALFGREICIDNSKILRLVDYRGNIEHLGKIGDALHRLIIEESYEYIDLMVSDLSDVSLQDAGFCLLDVDGETVIPHYFEPFEKRNIKNHYQASADIVIFKADGDQDRPNRIK